MILVAALGIIFRSKISHKTTKISLSIQIMTYVILGWIVFIMLPAIVFTYIENWTYLESVYFAFISLTTIGFGEYVSGKTQKNYRGFHSILDILMGSYKSFNLKPKLPKPRIGLFIIFIKFLFQ